MVKPPVRPEWLYEPRSRYEELCGQVKELVRDAIGVAAEFRTTSALECIADAERRVIGSATGAADFHLAIRGLRHRVMLTHWGLNAVTWTVRKDHGDFTDAVSGGTCFEALAYLVRLQRGES